MPYFLSKKTNMCIESCVNLFREGSDKEPRSIHLRIVMTYIFFMSFLFISPNLRGSR